MSAVTVPGQTNAPRQSLAEPVNLFAGVAKDCRVVRLSGADARRQSDTWKDLETLVLPCENMYPQIGKWLDKKVRSGLASQERNVFVGYYNAQPAVAAIVKAGGTSKFCHLSVAQSLQRRRVGELFFAMMAMSVQKQARHLRFTLPEGLWGKERSFFESFSFRHAKPIDRQYRPFEPEVLCQASFADVWPNVIRKVAKLRQAVAIDGVGWDQDLIMSVRPEHAERILAGRKTVEIRRMFSTARVPATCVLYASSPVQEIVGQVDVVRATKLNPSDAWIRFGDRIQCSWNELAEYASGTDEVRALELANPVPYTNTVALSAIRSWLADPIRPPQSYTFISDGSGWECAMPVIAMLQTG